MKDHLLYYYRNNIIPTIDLNEIKRDINNQRTNYYFKIGLTKGDFLNKSVLELCPGSGYNAYFLNKFCSTKEVKLVEKNPSSLKLLKKNLSKFKDVKIMNQDIYLFDTKKKFDYVIMENGIDAFENDTIIFNKLCKFTKTGGNIILTMGDLFGIFPTKLRYLFATIILEQNKITNFKEKFFFLGTVFKSHLGYLSKNTRPVQKWVIDNILNDGFIRKKSYFDYIKLRKILKKNFLIRSSSPLFSKDFEFYKLMKNNKRNSKIFNDYLKERINFLDFETKFKSNPSVLYKHIVKFYLKLSKVEINKKINIKILNSIIIELKKIKIILNEINEDNKVSLAIEEILNLISQFKRKEKINLKTKYFYKLWGVYNQTIILHKK